MNIMSGMSEQEKLSRLASAGNPDFDSGDLLTQGLMKHLGPPTQQRIDEVKEEIICSGEELSETPISTFSSNSKQSIRTSAPKRDTELINTLKGIHSGLVDVFERSGLNSGIEDSLTRLIEYSCACLNHLGETTQRFEPLRHLSGLEAPNMVKNATKVIETTLNCYKIGSIDKCDASDDGSKIEIVFSGKNNGVAYRASGSVVANSWEGSEAIDYIYTPGSGKMSVKAFEGGKWIDKSGGYEISWQLEEDDGSSRQETLTNEVVEEVSMEDVEASIEPSVAPLVEASIEVPVEASVSAKEKNIVLEEKAQDCLNNSTIKKSESVVDEKTSDNKKEVLSLSSNNDFDDEEIGDFPINDR